MICKVRLNKINSDFIHIMVKDKKTDTIKDLTDKEVIEKIIQKGEKELLEIIYERYATKVFHKCISLIKNREIAKDLAHDIMIKIFLSLSKFKGKSAFSLWVHSITYNHCMDYLRKKKKLKYESYVEKDYEHLTNDTTQKEEAILMELQLTQLEEVFVELHAEEKLILLMRYQDGMSIKQIGQTLNLGESAVKMRLKRSRDRLAKLLNK